MGGRRSNGEGSLRRVAGRNLYQYRWTEWVDQEAVRRVAYARKRALAVTELRRATMRAAAGRVGADSTAPLRVVAARWEARAGVAQRLAPSTVKAYSGVLHRHVLPVIGGLVVTYLKAMIKVGRWANANKQAAAAILDRQTYYRDVEDTYQSIKHVDMVPSLSPKNLAQIEIGKDFMLEHGYIQRDFDVHEWAAPEFLEKAAGELIEEQWNKVSYAKLPQATEMDIAFPHVG